jgi:hypothetical protein
MKKQCCYLPVYELPGPRVKKKWVSGFIKIKPPTHFFS